MESYTLQPKRIKEGRLFRGLTQESLADAISVTKQAVSQYETGVLTPNLEVITRIADVLDFPQQYFSKPYQNEILTPVFFRKRKTTTKKLMELFQIYIGWMADIYAYIEQYIHLPELSLPTNERVGYTRKEISDIAKSVRRHWGLGDGPISNLALLLENNGILISKVGLDAKKADACSVFFTAPGTAKRPMIFLTSGTSAVRSRRDLAHELGHQVLHSWMDKDQFEEHQDIIEEEAETFASYFLMPEQAMQRESYAVKSLDALLLMKARWGASAQSILYHLAGIDCITESTATRLKTSLYRKGWRTKEPGDDNIPQERPELIKDAVTVIVENNVKSSVEILSDIPMPAEDVAALCGVQKDFFLPPKAVRPSLRLVK